MQLQKAVRPSPAATGAEPQGKDLGQINPNATPITQSLQVHPAALAFPEMPDDELKALASDIHDNGLANAIVRDANGLLLDGRNRLKACKRAGVEPRFETYKGDNAVSLIISANLRRRHMDESQRAVVAAKLARLSHGGDRRSDQAAKLPHEIPTQAAAAAILNVSDRLLRDAGAVIKHGSPELVRDVEAGKISVSKAAKVARPARPRPSWKPGPKPKPKSVIFIARIKSAFVRVEKAAANGDAKLFQKELRQLITAAQEQIK